MVNKLLYKDRGFESLTTHQYVYDMSKQMDTKLKGDIAEQSVILFALKQGWAVLTPIGDRLSYDIVLHIEACFVKLQVKSAWFDSKSQNYVVDTRRTK